MTRLDDCEDADSQDDWEWCEACGYDSMLPCRGVGVLLPDGTQVALFRLDDGSLYAISNIDPFSGTAVMSRGIVGDRGGRACVQTPIKKQAFAFDDGGCLDHPGVALAVFRTRITPLGLVQIAA
jgi:nitrite reductase (NADH) small subunit